MKIVADTSLVSPADRLEYWVDATPKAFLHPLAIKAPGDRTFAGRIVSYQLGPVTAYRVTGDVSSASLSAASITNCDPERLSLALVLRGRHEVMQERRRAAVGPGDLVAVHTSSPYATRFATPYDLALFVVPRVLLRPYSDRIGARTAERIAPTHGAGRVAAGLLRSLAIELAEGELGDADEAFGETVIDLVRGIYAPTGTVPDHVGANVQRRELHARLRSYIDLHISDPALTPERIAHEHFISVRYLYKLFGDDGGVAKLIRAKRLERCRRDLVDEALGDHTVAAVAFRWGFNDPGYFSRLFRLTYGVSPTQFRDTQGAGLPPSDDGGVEGRRSE